MTLNIRAFGVISNPSQDTPMFSPISAKRIATLDARLYNFADKTRAAPVAFGEGTSAQRTFTANDALPLPMFVNNADKHFDLSGSSLLTATFTPLVDTPLTFVYVVKIADWSVYKNTITEMSSVGSGDARLFTVGSNSDFRHLIVPTKTGMGAICGGDTTKGTIIAETTAGWFIHVVHFNGANSKIINSQRSMTSLALVASSQGVDKIYFGARVGYNETIPGVKFKHFSLYSGAATEDELYTLYDELKISLGI